MAKVFIDLSGGLIHSAVADTEVELIFVDYDDIEDGEKITTIDGNDAYVFSGISVEVDAERTDSLFAQAKEVK